MQFVVDRKIIMRKTVLKVSKSCISLQFDYQIKGMMHRTLYYYEIIEHFFISFLEFYLIHIYCLLWTDEWEMGHKTNLSYDEN